MTVIPHTGGRTLGARWSVPHESTDEKVVERGEGWWLCGLLALSAVWIGMLVLVYLKATAS